MDKLVFACRCLHFRNLGKSIFQLLTIFSCVPHSLCEVSWSCHHLMCTGVGRAKRVRCCMVIVYVIGHQVQRFPEDYDGNVQRSHSRFWERVTLHVCMRVSSTLKTFNCRYRSRSGIVQQNKAKLAALL